MRTLTTAMAILAAAGALFGSVLITQAKGPFRAEISGGDLTEPVKIDGPISGDIIFENQQLSSKPPASLDPAYTIKLMPADPSRGEDFVITMTYFPGKGDGPAVIKGDWEPKDHYFRATSEFQAMLDDAISGGKPATMAGDDDGVSAVWYIAPSLVAVGLLLAGGLAGRRLLFRHDE